MQSTQKQINSKKCHIDDIYLTGVYVCICVGIIKWEVQKLLAQSSGEQEEGQEVIGILYVPKRRQSGESPRGYDFKRWDKTIP